MTSPGIPPEEAIDAAEATLRSYLGPWLPAEVHGTTLGSQLRTAVSLALRDAEAVWPHDPPRRSPESATSGDFGRAPAPRTRHMDALPPRVPKRAPGFGFTPPEVTG